MAGDAKNIQMNEFRVWHLHFNSWQLLKISLNLKLALLIKCCLYKKSVYSVNTASQKQEFRNQ